jgi:hypothetical protein
MNGFIFLFPFFFNIFQCLFLFYQVKATAENVDEAVRELPDANLVRYFFCFMFRLIINDAFVIALKDLQRGFTYQNNRLYLSYLVTNPYNLIPLKFKQELCESFDFIKFPQTRDIKCSN